MSAICTTTLNPNHTQALTPEQQPLQPATAVWSQIEPELHIDAAPSTVDDLQRFIPQLLHITPPGTKPAADAPNVGRAPSLTAFFST